MNQSPPRQPALRRVWLVWALVILLAGGVVVAYNYSVFRSRLLARSHNIPPIKVLPDFDLMERGGKPLRKADLLGHVWLANFIFTRCPGPCATLSRTMADYQKRLAARPGVRLVSFTVDPEFDTPGVLAAYADTYGADSGRWLFVTGNMEAMRGIVIRGFMLPVVENRPEVAESGGLFIHSERVVLMDKQSRIRGYYDTGSPEAVEKLFADIDFLEGQP